MNILLYFIIILGLSLMSRVAGYSTKNICKTGELDLLIILNCQRPPLKWDMIKNIFKLLKPADSKNATRKVTLIDMLSLNNISLNDSNINNVSKLCEVEDYDNSSVDENVLKLQDYISRNDKYSSKLFIIYISKNSYEIIFDFEIKLQNLKYIEFLIISFLDWKEWRRPSYPSSFVEVDNQDDLLYNNAISVRLCFRCLEGWISIRSRRSKAPFYSCYMFEEQRELINWKEAANFCVKKSSNMITFETSWDFEKLKLNLRDLINTYKKTNFQSNDSLLFYVGLNSLKAGYNEKLFWINNQPVNSFMYSKVTNVSNLQQKRHVSCFAWNQNDVILTIQCEAKLTKFLLCEQKFQRAKLRVSTNKKQVYTVPNKNFIRINTEIASISYFGTTRYKFPKFVCDYFGSSYNFVCDGFIDCRNEEDEKVCTYLFQDLKDCIQSEKFLCREPNMYGFKCIAKSQVCNMIEDCPDGSDETNCDDCILTQCSPDVCIPDYWSLNCSTANSLKINETNEGISEISTNVSGSLLQNLLDVITICDFTYIKSKVKTNRLVKYNQVWSPKCLYIKDRKGSQMGCSDLSHLSNCRTFKCPIGFSKCWNSYCIPDFYVDDNVMDCPYGEDEIRYQKRHRFYFRCYQIDKYIHPIYICDGKANCPRGDDELNCIDLCPSGFICIDGTATVNQTDTVLNYTFFAPNLTYLNISGIDVFQNDNFINIFSLKKLLVLIASRCHINDNTKSNAQNSLVYHLDISYNDLSRLTFHDFISQFSNLYFLNVSHNDHLSVIPNYYFLRFQNLISVDLSFTRIKRISLNFNDKIRFLNLSVTNLQNVVFSQYAEYQIVDLRNTLLSDFIKEKFFNNITVTGKVLADYKLCCSYFRGEKLPAHQCEAEEQPLSTCEDLIGHSLKRVLLWIVAFCAVFGNMMALGYRILFERATLHLTYVLFVTCLGVSDLIMGVYLVIIASVDVVYRDVYIVHEMSWKQSTLCQIAGTLATLSSETSTFFILFITLERFLTIRFPFGEHKISKSGKYVLISLAWCFGLFLSVVPILFRDMSLYSNNGMCLGFPLRKSSGTAWIYSVTVFLFFNSILFVVIAIGQFLIFITISQHSSKFKSESQALARRADNITVALKLSVVVLSNFICWFPVCVLAIRTVFSDYEVTLETYAWIIVLVLPFNSALNPVLYTLPRISKSWMDFKRRQSTRVSKS
ncbi:G-protein coupled receptor GRL101-like [Biomphalaria glabrata]|uniref:G-protein coupled receptor GRL101-like n=1 Tax=Biomphalaria glabrata TaxID=6526 RepID=A0A9W3BQA7_BIOGL|nr:G-protein coupled receptor GRL101-like [Biomphalaria glabrata]